MKDLLRVRLDARLSDEEALLFLVGELLPISLVPEPLVHAFEVQVDGPGELHDVFSVPLGGVSVEKGAHDTCLLLGLRFQFKALATLRQHCN